MPTNAPLSGGIEGRAEQPPAVPASKVALPARPAEPPRAVYRGRLFDTSRDLAQVAVAASNDGQQAVGPTPSLSNNAVLANAVRDVRVLISYLSRLHLETPTKDQILIPAVCLEVLHNIERKRVLSAGEEVFMWSFLAELHAAAHPATPDTIRNSSMADEIGVETVDGRGRASRNIFWTLAATILVGTLFVGAYLALAERLIEENQDKTKEYFSIVSRVYAETRLEHANLKAPSTPSDGNGTGETQDVARSTSSDGYTSSGMVYDYPEEIRDSALAQISNEIIENNRVLRGLGWPAAWFFGWHDVRMPDDTLSVFDKGAVSQQQSINELISAFLFPVLSALLGAVVFIIRDNHFRRENIQLSTRQYSYYGPRIILSAISGIIVGWLAKENGDLLGKLSPVIVAFLIGYSTDVLFNILDTLKASVGGRNVSLK